MPRDLDQRPTSSELQPWTRIRLAIEAYKREYGKDYSTLWREMDLRNSEQLSQLRGIRKPEPSEKLLRRAHEFLDRAGAYQLISYGYIQDFWSVGSLVGFKLIEDGIPEFNSDSEHYTGEWIGVGGSTFERGLFYIFRLRLEKDGPSFRAHYVQRLQRPRKLTDYRGRGYTVLQQLWILVEGHEAEELVCMAFELPFNPPRSCLTGVFLGRGQSRLSPPRAAKVAIVRSSYAAKLGDLIESGWVDGSVLLEISKGNSTLRSAVDYVKDSVAMGSARD